MSETILIVEDDALQRRMLALTLKREGSYTVIEAEQGRAALDMLAQSVYAQKVRAVILDLEMPIMGGLETLAILKEQYPHLPVIMLTGHNNPEYIVESMKAGAIDFITKPYEPSRVIITLQNALKINTLTREVERIQHKEQESLKFNDLIGADKGLKDAVARGYKAAQSNIPVLITGETGVGKEMFAHAIHGESARAGKPFIAINCGAIPSNLVESILFGHEKGAFTGATTRTMGKFREAENGTIFLDEVGELPKDTQVKLLRVLQQKEIEPVGADRPVKVNARIISATNRDLMDDVRQQKFREDLYFRLNVLTIDIPPLRHRLDDINDLAHYFVTKYCALYQKPLKIIAETALINLKSHPWHGNVRELENIIHREIVLHDSTNTIEFNDINSLGNFEKNFYKQQLKPFLYKDEGTRLKTLEEMENEVITHALDIFAGDVIKAAAAIGVAKSTLYRKLEKIKRD